MSTNSSEATDPVRPDALSEILQDLRLSGVSYGHCRLTRPWGVDISAEPTARLHFVVAGGGWLRGPDFGPVRLGPGDVALLPRGAAHKITDSPRGHARPLAEFPREQIGERTYRLDAGGSGAETLMACCSVELRQPALHPVLDLMPAVVVVHGATTKDTTLPALLNAMADEVMLPRVGAATVLARLADVVVARLIRTWVESRGDETRGWLAAIRDPRIGAALAAVHRRPEQPWSVDLLAKEASLSRSSFSERFSSVMGVAPAHYVASWRMHLATTLLRDEHMTVSEVAQRLGYDSEPSFSRAFKRIVGAAPSVVRRGLLISSGVEA